MIDIDVTDDLLPSSWNLWTGPNLNTESTTAACIKKMVHFEQPSLQKDWQMPASELRVTLEVNIQGRAGWLVGILARKKLNLL